MKGKLVGYDSEECCFIFEIKDEKTALEIYERLREKHFYPKLKGINVLANWRIDYHGWLSEDWEEVKLIEGYREYCREQRERNWRRYELGALR